MRTFTIVATAANGMLSSLHTRMPIMLPREAWPGWLSEDGGDVDSVTSPLEGHLTPPLAIWPVSLRVGRVSENDAALTERLARPGAAGA